MASALTHGLWTALLLRAAPGVKVPLRVQVAAMVCACLPDLDFLMVPFSEAPGDLVAHRGLVHSPLFALLAALVAALVVTPPRALRAHYLRHVGILFAAGLGHILLDLLTWGGPGVALLAPFSDSRVLLPRELRLMPVVPVGMNEWLGPLGAQALAIEALFVLLPTLLLLPTPRGAWGTRGGRRTRWLVIAACWAVLAGALRVFGPVGFSLPPERVLSELPNDPRELPSVLPGPPLVTRFDELRARGLFDRELVPQRAPWSSGFFPFWFGGQAGRWQDPVPLLVGRTLFGASAPATPVPDDRVHMLAPTEKYDLARADLSFSATRTTLAQTHNRRPRPRFWFGLCNGAASAALAVDEPFRTVDVVNRAGTRVRFHPNDIKALLATAYYQPKDLWLLGDLCSQTGFDVGATCSVHPASFALAVLNRLGVQQQSFLIEVHPTKQAQYYAVSGAKIRVVRNPYDRGSEPLSAQLADRVAKLVDVVVQIDGSSTLLPAKEADVPDPRWREGSGYHRVGTRPVRFEYPITLALDAATEIIGGRYTGDPADGPDQLEFDGTSPAVRADGTLAAAPELRWRPIEALAAASLSVSDAPPTVDAALFADPP